MPKYLSGEDPPKKKSPIEAALASAVQRPDALPRAPKPRMLPEFYIDPTDKRQPPQERLRARSVPDPDEAVKSLPFRSPLAQGKVAPELQWMYPFLDSLTQVVGNEPGYIEAYANPEAPYITGEFMPKGRRITMGGNIYPKEAFGDEEWARWTAAHEYGHLLTHNDNSILQAFVDAAPLPKHLNVTPQDDKDYNFNSQYRLIPELTTNEAFSDMFADALAKRFPGMSGQEDRAHHYPFTNQFRGRSRQVMMDSLVNSLTERLKQ